MAMNNIVIIFGIALSITIYLSGPISLGVMAREQPFDQITCTPATTGVYLKCCQTFIDDDKSLRIYCAICDNTTPPSNCGERFEVPRTGDVSPGVPPKGGVDDDPTSNDNVNPDIPSQDGVVDDPVNNNNDVSPDAPTKDGGLSAPNNGGGLAQ